MNENVTLGIPISWEGIVIMSFSIGLVLFLTIYCLVKLSKKE